MSTRTRLWILIAGVFCVALILFGVIRGLLPQLTAVARTTDQSETNEIMNEALRTQIAAAEQADQGRADLQAELAALRAAVPATAGSDAWSDQLEVLESRTGASISLFELTAPEPVANDSAAESAENDATDASNAAGERTDEAGSAATSPAPGIIAVPFTLEATGSRSELVAFTRELQVGERLVVVDFVMQSGSGSSWQTRIIGELYVSSD